MADYDPWESYWANFPDNPDNPYPGGVSTGGTGATGGGGGAGTGASPFGMSGDMFDLPQFGGPYSAPLLQGQLDSLQGFNRLFNGNPLLQSGDLQKAIEFAVSGGSVYNPAQGKTLASAVEPYRLPSAATGVAQEGATTGFQQAPVPGLQSMLSAIQGGLGTALGAPRYDTTEMFRTGEDVFRSDMERAMANIREEYSGLGLGAGSTDRSGRLLREAGDLSSKFRLGQQEIGRQSFENAEGRRLGALQAAPGAISASLAPSLANASLGERAADRRLSSAGLLAELENVPFERFYNIAENAAGRAQGALPYIFDLEQRPFDRYAQQYGMNETARQVADTESVRRQGEFARTQGGGLNQLLSILAETPLNNTAVGPSFMSQLAETLKGIGSITNKSPF